MSVQLAIIRSEGDPGTATGITVDKLSREYNNVPQANEPVNVFY